MSAESEAILPAVRRGIRGFRILILRVFLTFSLLAAGFALHAATWSRVVAVLLLLGFAVFYLLVPWVRAGFVGASALHAMLAETPERTAWLAVHQVPKRQAHLQVHDDDRHSWRLRLPPQEVAELIAAWQDLVPGVHVSMADTQREVEWFHDPKAPRSWPKAPALELTELGFKNAGD